MMNTNPTKTFSWKKAFVLSVSAGLLAGFLSIVFQVKGNTFIRGFIAAEPSPAVAATATTNISSTTGLGSSFYAPLKPIRLVIPAIGVDAAIQSVGLYWNGNGEMSIPTNFTDVAWYNGGPRPGMPGSAVIDGHLDGKNVEEAVFYNLGNLKIDDQVGVVDASGTMIRFRVVKVVTYDYNATTTDVFSGDTSKARLNLITCAGTWIPGQKIYDKRIVVYTEAIF
jgi:hypothetical protein